MVKSTLRIVQIMFAVAVTISTNLHSQVGSPRGEWPTYGGDLRHTRYAPLDQISVSNFNRLEVAWRFKTDNLGPIPDYRFEATPLMVGGIVYSTAGSRKAVIALDAGTGELLWMHSENEGQRAEAATRKLSRGLAYWTDGRESRIFYVTIGYRLVALDAKTGALVTSFGKGGIIDLKQDNDQTIDLIWGDVGLQSTPTVANDVVIVGAAHAGGPYPRSRSNAKGYVRGFDARTGKRLWIFHTIPRPGEFGNDTWENDSWAYTGHTGVWTQISADLELGLAYLPVESPTSDFYGGQRPGNNLFAESIVAVDLKTGKRKWHYQLVHHPLWDMDNSSPSILADVPIGGRVRKILAQPSKQKFLYVFDRVTGEPIWPIEERPVPQSDVPGEKTSPTQPFPTKPPAYGHQDTSIDRLIDFTPELRAEAIKVASRYKLGPMFTPPSVRKPGGPVDLLINTMGTIWEGGAYDPETHHVYVHSGERFYPMSLKTPDPCGSPDLDFVMAGRSPMPYRNEPGRGPCPPSAEGAGGGDGEVGGGPRVKGLPLNKPPYGSITAIDLTRGDIVWQIAHGDTPDNIKNHPDLKGVNIPRTGRGGNVGMLVTKTLVISGEAGIATQPDGRRGALLRAYDKMTGNDVGGVFMPAGQSGSPMTYMHNGKQYIIVAISGGNHPGELLAFKLPDQ